MTTITTSHPTIRATRGPAPLASPAPTKDGTDGLDELGQHDFRSVTGSLPTFNARVGPGRVQPTRRPGPNDPFGNVLGVMYNPIDPPLVVIRWI
jgi:hypothetical protein